MVNELKELGNEDKAFKCVLPAVEMLTSNKKVNEHRQKLADKVRGFFTDMTEKLVTKIVDFAVDKLIDGLDKILSASTLLQEIMDEVGNVVVGRLQQNMDAVTGTLPCIRANTCASMHACMHTRRSDGRLEQRKEGERAGGSGGWKSAQ